jgi:class 3 adenylate cyclase/tetratricopeptide (TPR) repeat protein
MARYRLIEPLGGGGMADVYLAEDLQLGRHVALKFLSAALASDPSAHERLQREARSAAALDHPSICKIFEIGELDGRPFIAMEYVRGRTLRARLDQGPLLCDEVRATALAVADALSDAHRHGIVHRDLKPANIMLADQGHVKVMDFGLARQVEAAALDGDAPTVAGITQAGVRLGTPAYMSPEQVLGGVVDRASDVFSFGIVLVEMLTAVHPFARDTAAATMGAIVREVPVLPDAIRGSLRALVERTLAKDGRHRPAIADVVQGLRDASTWPAPSASPRQRARAERRVATVLVVGAIGGSGIRRDADDEAALESLHRAVTVLEEQALGHDGTVTERRDDGLVVMFGAPVSHENSVQLAVQAALAMREALRVLSLDVRAGLHTGPVAVEGTESGRARITALGDTARVAARLEARADAGDVLVSARTALAIAPYFDCLALNGDAEGSCRVVRASGVRARFDAARQKGLSAFVGRTGELALLGRAFERAREGEGQIVLISGEPGIGKSRLVAEFQRVVTGDSCAWLDAACTTTARGTPYQAIASLLRHAFGVSDSDDESRILRRIDEDIFDWQEEARRTVPFLKTVLNVDAGDPSLALMDPAEYRLGIHAGVAALLSERTRTGPVVVAIEDLHWMDGPSEDALAAASDLVASLPVLLVLTVRPGHAGKLGERSFIHRMQMAALGPAEGHALVQSLLAHQSPSDDIARLVVARAGGNPLFVEEVTRTLVETDAIRSTADGHGPDPLADGIRVPDTIGQVILARIDRLPVAARDVLQRAAVIGREFTARVLHRLPLDSGGLEASLDTLKAQEFIREKSRFPELTYAFRHALVHEVAYSTLLTGRRRELHRGVADALEQLHADRLTDYCEVLAHHTVEGQDWARAVEYLDRAAERAAGLYSNDEAADFYARAIATCHEVGDSALGRAIDLSRRRGELLTDVGRLDEAIATLADMGALAVRAGDRHAEGVAKALEGWTHGLRHNLAASEAASKAALQIVAATDDDELRFLASGSLALFLYGHNRADDAEPYLRMAEELAARVDDPYRQGWWGVTGWHQLQWEGRLDEVLQHLERWRPAASRSRSRFVMLGLEWEEALARASKGEYSRALAMLDALLRTCDRLGNTYFSIRTINTVGWIYGELEDHARALEWNRRGVQVATEANEVHPEVECNARLNVGDNLMALGQLDAAEAEFQHVERIVRDPLPHQILDLWRYAQHVFHAYGELWLIRGDVDRALQYADECLALAEPARHWKNAAKGRRLRGEARLAQSRLDDADAELARALVAAERVGNPPQLWKTLAAVGDLRRAQGRDGDARQWFSRALDVIDTVARGLDDVALCDTFLTSPHVQSIRRRGVHLHV